MVSASDVAMAADQSFDETVELLSSYLKIPAISCDSQHFDDVQKLAEAIRNDLEATGLDNARVLSVEGALPCVAAERLRAGPDKPTVLVYGHLDLQPVKGEPWDTDPHEAVIKGDRLYARGAADDMGGWVSHMAAVKAWLAVAGELPVNVKIFIEGEEEIGSPNLERYMDAFPEAFASDVMVLTDCENPSVDIPGLTVSLRGLLEVELTVSALGSDVHSGLWGNMVPDVSTLLVKTLARIIDDDGRLSIPELQTSSPPEWQQAAWNVPLDTATIRSGARLIDEVSPLPDRGRPPAEWLWRQPAVTILSTTLPTPDARKNALRTSASAVLSIRVAPGQSADQVLASLERTLLSPPAGGARVTLNPLPGAADSWLYTPRGPAFEAADRAYSKAWGRPMLHIGVGGSIPFVALFGRRFGDLPLILNGVMDPETGAHGPNESLHLGVFRKAISANVYLYDELAKLTELTR